MEKFLDYVFIFARNPHKPIELLKLIHSEIEIETTIFTKGLSFLSGHKGSVEMIERAKLCSSMAPWAAEYRYYYGK